VCQKKAIKAAYHTICDACAEKDKVCAKCREPKDIVTTGKEKMSKQEQERTLERVLKDVPERRRRTIVRKLERGDLDLEEAISLAQLQQKDEDFDFSDDVGDEPGSGASDLDDGDSQDSPDSDIEDEK